MLSGGGLALVKDMFRTFFIQVGDWLKRVGQWLWRGRLLCGAVSSLLLVPAACALIIEDRELQIRYSGLAFELLGLLLVIRGIRETRTLFKKPSLRRFAAAWLRSWPSWRVAAHVRVGVGHAAVGDMTASLRGTAEISADATLEQKVEALRLQMKVLTDDVATVRADHERRLSAQQDELANEKRARADGDAAIRVLIDESIAGGLHLEAIGVVWLLLGIVLSTASTEVAKLFGWIAQW
jgi:hypothetical protein